MQSKVQKQKDIVENLLHAHCLTQAPYRFIVFDHVNKDNTPLYSVARSQDAPCKARKALKRAFITHGANCFYCDQPVDAENYTVDHIDPKSMGGTEELQNLAIACKPCNRAKQNDPLLIFKPSANNDWLRAKLNMIEQRLKIQNNQ